MSERKPGHQRRSASQRTLMSLGIPCHWGELPTQGEMQWLTPCLATSSSLLRLALKAPESQSVGFEVQGSRLVYHGFEYEWLSQVEPLHGVHNNLKEKLRIDSGARCYSAAVCSNGVNWAGSGR